MEPPEKSSSKFSQFIADFQGVIVIITAVCSLLSMVCMGYTVLWLRENFVPRPEYQNDRTNDAIIFSKLTEQASTTSQTLAVIAERMKADERQERQLDDHERRIRDLERAVPAKR